VTHSIRLKKDQPFRLRPYPVSEKKKKQLFHSVQEMLAAGVIERSVSDYCSPAVLVAKKDGTVRFCTDYRKLNLLTKDEAAPLPKISDALRDCVLSHRLKIRVLVNPDGQGVKAPHRVREA
jgi:hypothetical protein